MDDQDYQHLSIVLHTHWNRMTVWTWKRREEPTQPPTVICKMEAQLKYRVYTAHTRFCTFGANLYAQSVLIKKSLHWS